MEHKLDIQMKRQENIEGLLETLVRNSTQKAPRGANTVRQLKMPPRAIDFSENEQESAAPPVKRQKRVRERQDEAMASHRKRIRDGKKK